MKFVIGFILIMLVILAEVQKEKMSMLMSNSLVKLTMLLTIVFIFKTKNIILGVITGIIFICLLVMTSKPVQEAFNNHGESNSLYDEEHMHVVENVRGKNKGKSCNNLKLVPYKKNREPSKRQENTVYKNNTKSKNTGHKSKTSRLSVEELLHKGNINSININFDRTSRGKEPVAVCPPGFKGPNKKGDCTARWYNGCGYECHKKKCEAYGGSFSDHDFRGNFNYKCVPSMLSEFGDLKEETVNETITMKNNGNGKMKQHSRSSEFSTINSRLDGIEDSMEGYDISSLEEKLDSIAHRFASDSTPANVKSMPTESGRGSQYTAQPASAAGMMAFTEESETDAAEQEAAAADQKAAAAEQKAAAAEQEAAAAEQEEAEAKRKAKQAAAAQKKAEQARLKKEEAKRKAEAEAVQIKAKCPKSHPNPYDGGGTNKGYCCNKSPITTGMYGTKLDNCNGGQYIKCETSSCEPANQHSNISTNGRCGRQGDDKTCPGNGHCSKFGWCGTSIAHKNGQTSFNGPDA